MEKFSVFWNIFVWELSKSDFCRVPVVLVGNKTDLHMERVITYEEGKKLAEDWNAIFLETSAKQTAVSINKTNFKKCYKDFFLQSASEIFHMLLLEMEKIDGILGDRPNCVVS